MRQGHLGTKGEQCFLTCAAQNMKKMAKVFFTSLLSDIHPNPTRFSLCLFETYAV